MSYSDIIRNLGRQKPQTQQPKEPLVSLSVYEMTGGAEAERQRNAVRREQKEAEELVDFKADIMTETILGLLNDNPRIEVKPKELQEIMDSITPAGPLNKYTNFQKVAKRLKNSYNDRYWEKLGVTHHKSESGTHIFYRTEYWGELWATGKAPEVEIQQGVSKTGATYYETPIEKTPPRSHTRKATGATEKRLATIYELALELMDAVDAGDIREAQELALRIGVTAAPDDLPEAFRG